MRKLSKTRRMAVILTGILVMNSLSGYISPHITGMAYVEKPAIVNASSLNVRSGPGTGYSVVTRLTNGASVTVMDEKTASDGAAWYQIRMLGTGGREVTGYVSKSYLKFPAAYTGDSGFEARLTSEGFPESYKVKLRQLHAQHPTWVFKAQNTNLDWNDAVHAESQVGRTLVHTNSMSSWKSTENGAYNWDSGAWTGFDGSSWVSASRDIVKYYMDPRNFLDDTNVFQFLSHSYDSNSHTVEGLQTMVKGTFLAGMIPGGGNQGSSPSGTPDSPGDGSSSQGGNSGPSSGQSQPGESQSQTGPGPGGGAPDVALEGPHASITPNNTPALMDYGPGVTPGGPGVPGNSDGGVLASGSGSYADILMNAGIQSGVNPYVLAAMIIQEQGSNGSGGSISGRAPGYEGYYNYFNIEAYQSGSMSPVQRGLWWASQSGSYNRPWNTPEKSILGGAAYYGNNYVKVGQDTFYLKKFNVQGANPYKHQYMTNVQGAASEGAVYAKAYNDEMKNTALEFKIPVYKNMPDSPCLQPTGDGSPNNKLSGLSADGYVITPTYNKDTFEYNLIVDPSVSGINVSAAAIDSKASVSGTGTVSLNSGNNDVKITVTAQNGSVREYVIHVVRQNGGAASPSAENPGGGQKASGKSGSLDGPGSGQTGPGAGAGPGGSGSTGNSGNTSGGETDTPGGSNVTIIR